MSRDLAAFVTNFVSPLLRGGEVHVGAPYTATEHDNLLARGGFVLESPDLREDFGRRMTVLHPDFSFPELDASDAMLWLGLHNVLTLDHPDVRRVWTRATTWIRVEAETRAMLNSARAVEKDALHTRHAAVEPFLALVRDDVLVGSEETEQRFLGMASRPAHGRVERNHWISQPHSEGTARLLAHVLGASPLTCLLHPEYAPANWSPLDATPCLQDRATVRAICRRWALSPQWIENGGLVAASLVDALGLRAAVFGGFGDARGHDDEAGDGLALPGREPDPFEVGALLGALVHLHFLAVVDLDARLGIAATHRTWAVQAFLALPLLLPAVVPVLGDPTVGLGVPGTRRWEAYLEHLRSVVPASIVSNLLARLVPRVVERRTA